MRATNTRDVGKLVVGLFSLGIGAAVLLDWEYIRDSLGRQTGDVASSVLADEKLQQSGVEMTRALVHGLIEDADTRRKTVDFLSNVSASKHVVNAAAALVADVLAREEVRATVFESGRDVLARLMNDEATRAAAVVFVNELLQDESTRARLVTLFQSVLADPTTRKSVSLLFADLLDTDEVTRSASALGVRAAHNTLESDSVHEHAVDVARGVLTDERVQKDAGDTLWNAAKYSVRPRWLWGSDETAAHAGDDRPPEPPQH